MFYSVGLIIIIVLTFYIFVQKLFFNKENNFLKELAKEIDCYYKKSIWGTGMIRGNYKNQEIEIGVYEGLGNFVKWINKALFLFSASTRETMRDERILGIKITIDKIVRKPRKTQTKMVVVGNHIFYIVKGQSRFLSFDSSNIKDVKEALERAVKTAKQIEMR